jgi:hypothetical protein
MSPTDDCKDGLTTNPDHADLGHGADDKPVPQNKCYLVLGDAERAKGFVRPVRRSYVHVGPPAVCSKPAQHYPNEPAEWPSYRYMHSTGVER